MINLFKNIKLPNFIPRSKWKANLEIINIVSELPMHKTRVWNTRSVSTINSIIVHQAASTGTLKNIAKYHVTPTCDRNNDGIVEDWERNHLTDKGAPGICYHFAITRDGKVYQTNNLSSVVWHAGVTEYNNRGIGVLVMGDFVGKSYTPKNKKLKNPSKEQLNSLGLLIDRLVKKYKIKEENILGHCEIKKSKENCPGNKIMNLIGEKYARKISLS